MKKVLLLLIGITLTLTLIGCDGNEIAPITVDLEENEVTVEVGATMPDLTSMIVVSGGTGVLVIDASMFDTSSVDLNILGTYDVPVLIESGEEVLLDDTVQINVVDTTPPEITLNGDSNVAVYVGSDYTELDASATDNYDTELDFIVEGSVDTSIIGEYQITYQAEDDSGNKSTVVTRTVNVVDVTVPMITGASNQTLEVGSTLPNMLTGVTASDFYETDLTSNLSVDTSAVNMNVVGDYNVVYSISDTYGHTTTQTITLSIVDTTVPVLSNVPTSLTVDLNETIDLTSYAITALDNYDGDLTSSINIDTSNLDVTVEGTYTIAVSVTDAALNKTETHVTVIVMQNLVEFLNGINELDPSNYTEETYLTVSELYGQIYLDEFGFDTEYTDEEIDLFDEVFDKLLDHFLIQGDEIYYLDDDYFYHEGDFVYLDDTKETLLSVKIDGYGQDIVIPEGVKTIHELAIIGMEMNSLTLPSTITQVNSMAIISEYITELIINFENATFEEASFSIYDGGIDIITLPTNFTVTYQSWKEAMLPAYLHPSVTLFGDYYYHKDSETLVYYNKDSVDNITVPVTINGDTISKIEDYAFNDLNLSGTLTIPSGITDIGKGAFRYNDFETLIMADSVITIGNESFISNNLTEITLSSNLEVIPREAFAYNDLETIDLMNVVSIEYRAFYGNEIDTLTIPATVLSIEEKAFDGKGAILDVTLLGDQTRFDQEWITLGFSYLSHPSAIIDNGIYFVKSTHTIIGYDGEYGQMIIIPDMIDGVEVNIIGEEAFRDKQIRYLVLPDTITRIESDAFYNNYIEEITLPSNLEFIGDSAFQDNNLTEITIPVNLEDIEYDAFYYNPFESITILGDDSRFDLMWEEIGFPLELHPAVITSGDFVFNTSTGEILEYLGSSLDVTIPDMIDGYEVLIIGSEVFESLGLNSVTINADLIEIGSYAFAYNNLTSITLPSTLEAIYNSAFYNNALTSITLPSSLNYIYYRAFYSNNIEEVILPEGLLEVGGYAFKDNPVTTLTIPSTIKYLSYDIVDETYMETVNVPDGLEIDYDYIGLPSFGTAPFISADGFIFDKETGTIMGYEGTLTDITIPSTIDGVTVTTIGNSAFEDITLESVILPNTIIRIESYAFANNFITTIVLPDSLEYIGYQAFEYNRLTSITVPVNVEYIGGYAFAYNDITTVTWNSLMTELPYSIFRDNNIQSFDLTGFTSINDSAFYNNDLIDIVIPESLNEIGYNAFKYNDNLETVTINGNGSRFNEDWNTIGFSYDLHPDVVYDDINGLYFNTNTQTIVDIDVAAGDLIIPATINGVSVLYLKDELAKYNHFTSVTLPEGLLGIGEYAFYYSYNLTTITIPSTVNSIGRDAFIYSYDLNTVTILGNQTRFSDEWLTIGFKYITNPALITIDNFIIDPSINAIVGYNGAENIDLVVPSTVGEYTIDTIYNRAFADKVFNTITISEGIKNINFFAFDDALATSLTLPSTLEYIGPGAFRNNQLTSLTLPSNVTYIGDSAFEYNDIATITFNNNLEFIGESAFAGNALTEVTIKAGVFYSSRSFTGNAITTVVVEEGVQFIQEAIFADNVITSVSLPSTLIAIGIDAFAYNSLTDITIPANVDKIFDGAFTGNDFTTFTIEGDSTRFNDELEDIGLVVASE